MLFIKYFRVLCNFISTLESEDNQQTTKNGPSDAPRRIVAYVGGIDLTGKYFNTTCICFIIQIRPKIKSWTGWTSKWKYRHGKPNPDSHSTMPMTSTHLRKQIPMHFRHFTGISGIIFFNHGNASVIEVPPPLTTRDRNRLRMSVLIAEIKMRHNFRGVYEKRGLNLLFFDANIVFCIWFWYNL